MADLSFNDLMNLSADIQSDVIYVDQMYELYPLSGIKFQSDVYLYGTTYFEGDIFIESDIIHGNIVQCNDIFVNNVFSDVIFSNSIETQILRYNFYDNHFKFSNKYLTIYDIDSDSPIFSNILNFNLISGIDNNLVTQLNNLFVNFLEFRLLNGILQYKLSSLYPNVNYLFIDVNENGTSYIYNQLGINIFPTPPAVAFFSNTWYNTTLKNNFIYNEILFGNHITNNYDINIKSLGNIYIDSLHNNIFLNGDITTHTIFNENLFTYRINSNYIYGNIIFGKNIIQSNIFNGNLINSKIINCNLINSNVVESSVICYNLINLNLKFDNKFLSIRNVDNNSLILSSQLNYNYIGTLNQSLVNSLNSLFNNFLQFRLLNGIFQWKLSDNLGNINFLFEYVNIFIYLQLGINWDEPPNGVAFFSNNWYDSKFNNNNIYNKILMGNRLNNDNNIEISSLGNIYINSHHNYIKINGELDAEYMDCSIINCNLINGNLINGNLINGKIINSNIINGNIINSNIINGNIINSNIINSKLINVNGNVNILGNNNVLSFPKNDLILSYPFNNNLPSSISFTPYQPVDFLGMRFYLIREGGIDWFIQDVDNDPGNGGNKDPFGTRAFFANFNNNDIPGKSTLIFYLFDESIKNITFDLNYRISTKSNEPDRLLIYKNGTLLANVKGNNNGDYLTFTYNNLNLKKSDELQISFESTGIEWFVCFNRAYFYFSNFQINYYNLILNRGDKGLTLYSSTISNLSFPMLYNQVLNPPIQLTATTNFQFGIILIGTKYKTPSTIGFTMFNSTSNDKITSITLFDMITNTSLISMNLANFNNPLFQTYIVDNNMVNASFNINNLSPNTQTCYLRAFGVFGSVAINSIFIY